MQSPSPDLSAPSILVVDDTPANLQMLADMLKRRGYRARPVPSGRLALLASKADPPDLILLDVNMPEMDGYEVCAELKKDESLAGIPVIFISAYGETVDKMRAFSAGGLDYITKPFHVEEVEARVAIHLQLRQQPREPGFYERCAQFAHLRNRRCSAGKILGKFSPPFAPMR